jgi:hypothetical protein
MQFLGVEKDGKSVHRRGAKYAEKKKQVPFIQHRRAAAECTLSATTTPELGMTPFVGG